MRPLLGVLAASLLLLVTSGARAAESAPSRGPVPYNSLSSSAPAPAPAQRVQTRGAITPRAVAASLVPDWVLKATLYHTGNPGVGLKDSIGCRPIAMRTVATDPRLIPRRTILFIAETVGLRMPGGGVHDGFWYASDVGGGIKGNRIDLYTGTGRASMAPAIALSLKNLRVVKAGTFRGCPQIGDHADMLIQIAQRAGILQPQFAIAQFIAEQWQRRQSGLIQP
jgi:3D (Asp-Asp-Asp) domain-containing protein